MKRKIPILILLVITAIAAGVAWRANREPSWQGRNLSSWLKDLDGSDLPEDQFKQEQARGAFRNMGEKALPQLLKILQSGDSKLKRWLADLFSRQNFIKYRFYWHETRMQAARAIVALGPDAKSAIPQLARLLEKEDSCEYASAALSGLGSDVAERLERLLAHPDPRARRISAYLIALTASDKKRFLNVLLQKTNDGNADVRSAAVRSVGILSIDDSIPPLRTLLLDTNLALDAAFSLAEVGGDGLLPLFDLAHSTNKILRTAAWGGLAYFSAKEKIQTRQTPPLQDYNLRQCLFNLKAMGGSWAMYSSKKPGIFTFAPIFTPLLTNSNPRISKAAQEAMAEIERFNSTNIEQITVEDLRLPNN